MPITALPPHLQKNNSMAIGRGTDWDVFGLRYIPEGWFAFGPNATEKWGWIPILPFPYWFQMTPVSFNLLGRKWTINLPEPCRWSKIVVPFPVPAKWRRFPLLLLGFDVTRWMGERDQSRLKVIEYKGKLCSSFFGRRRDVLVYKEVMGSDDPPSVYAIDNLKEYGPSPIQYWSPFGFQITWPLHFACQIQWGFSKVMQSYKKKIFFRFGFRWDSFDDYHDGITFFFGLTFN